MGNIYFIGDTHFLCKDILRYENRPFKSEIDMTEALIENWNKVVNDKDTVFHLGDFSEGMESDQREICSRLAGRKILIKGNHDTLSIRQYMKLGFDEVYNYPIILDNFWILSHEPLYINMNMPYANIFAHVHSNPQYTDYSSHSICVSVERDHMRYTPISFDSVKSLLNKSK